VLAPCAAGGLIDEALARALDCRVIAGAANNPLSDRGVARVLMERDILYVPDFLANCGGLIHVSTEWDSQRLRARPSRALAQGGHHGPREGELIAGAMERLELAIETAEAEGTPPIEVAERQALERVEAARNR
jgi:glutamate dehydrogenase/leucine dehydrogenase